MTREIINITEVLSHISLDRKHYEIKYAKCRKLFQFRFCQIKICICNNYISIILNRFKLTDIQFLL